MSTATVAIIVHYSKRCGLCLYAHSLLQLCSHFMLDSRGLFPDTTHMQLKVVNLCLVVDTVMKVLGDLLFGLN